MTDMPDPVLRRALNLPWLVFYGVGVTVGAGVFALIGEVVRVSGDHAVWAFLIAGLVAAFTALSMTLSSMVAIPFTRTTSAAPDNWPGSKFAMSIVARRAASGGLSAAIA
jgi:L-asparagine transporter-like permease